MKMRLLLLCAMRGKERVKYEKPDSKQRIIFNKRVREYLKEGKDKFSVCMNKAAADTLLGIQKEQQEPRCLHQKRIKKAKHPSE